MIRELAVAAAAALWAAGASAGGLLPGDGPTRTVTSATPGGPTLYSTVGAVAVPACAVRGGPALLFFAFADPDGIDYAAVQIGAETVRPAVSERAETWLWIPDYAREKRAYRWRFEDTGVLRARRIIPVALEIVPGDEPLNVHVETKDGDENLEVVDFTLSRAAIACR